jgi:dephospho-CoA kinase
VVPGIIILGKAGSGKTTLANFIVTHDPNSRFRKFALADKVKEIQRDLFPHLTGKPRHVLQHIGMSMREIDPYVWIKYLDKTILRYNAIPVIDDIRLTNEYEHYTNKNYISIRVLCDDDIRIERMRYRDGDVDLATLYHHTETELDDIVCDYTVDNNGTLDELATQVDAILDEVMAKERYKC